MKSLLFIVSALLPLSLCAEDIELYLGNAALNNQERPKVLVIFDTSGSMNSKVTVRSEYKPSENYDPLNGSDNLSKDTLYYVKGEVKNKPIPGLDLRFFPAQYNSCNTAAKRLASVGYYIGYMREYRFSGQSGAWQELPELNGSSINIADCWDDVRLSDTKNISQDKQGNNIPSGYPIDGLGDTSNVTPYTDDKNSSNTKLGAGEIVTLYTANYLRWLLGDKANSKIGTTNTPRLSIAKTAMKALVDAAPTVDFALAAFNRNKYESPYGNRHGGRIINSFKDNFDSTQAEAYKNKIDDLIAKNNTPLCESVYEAYRYLSGGNVYYGNDDSSVTPVRDKTAEIGDTLVYKKPFNTCSNKINIILMSDGAPTSDNHADNLVKALPNNNEGGYNYQYYNSKGKLVKRVSYLKSLAKWMHENDIDQNEGNGEQTADLYTVGFTLGEQHAVNILKEAASAGGGRYLDAQDPSDLLSELQSAIVSILQKDATFTPPSVGANNFDRTETLDSVYYAMFTPSKGPRWPGNLKKLKVRKDGLIDKNNVAAIDATTNNIKGTATTIWSSSNAKDGGQVSKGGVVEMFSKMSPSQRTIYTDVVNGDGDLIELENKSTVASVFGGDQQLASFMGVNVNDIDQYLNWAKGQDVDDEDGDKSTSDMRADVFGDPLHSKPLVLNYGTSKDDQDVRILIGTNAGALHMFNDDIDQSTANNDTVSESWAFMPTEFFKNIRTLRENFSSSDKVYGIDGAPVSFIIDVNDNGKIDDPNDKVYVFFGLRRGGDSYYGLDLTNPDKPKLLWHKTGSDFGSEIKQSWSTPRIGYSLINSEGDTPKPVLFIGGGYDTANDIQGDAAPVNTKGRGFFMLDALSGEIKWRLTPNTSPAFAGTDSIPSSIATLDSDSDGYVDRLYAGDTGGNVWRVDMPGTDTKAWQATQLAALGGNSHNVDRRFFAEPTIARALITETIAKEVEVDGIKKTQFFKTERPYDAILIGSGDRTNPLDEVTDDSLFMLKDENILTQEFSQAPDVITYNDLADYTADPFGQLDKNSANYQLLFDQLAASVSLKKGWRLDLAQQSGEKSVATPRVVSGVAYFNSYAPPSTNANSCEITETGSGYLYALDLSFGTEIYSKRILEVNSALVDSIPVVSIPDPEPDPDNPQPTNKVQGSSLAIIAGDALRLCEANGDCSGVKLKTMQSNLVVGEDN
ncbi:rRNA (guanine-N1)-methyltransferase [Thalassotalea euphylliae]|uniref:rRNA (Guanine-N1)-methyltransferase n=1 Tax=Thalassotalea euphylliae TaxID=1655234 RepID=A0A3E0TN76_9GAMM|nr:PilC/PilY family type IV pilus protein [Thalassotalea euphylliae]REL26006.1 rRNA (guanine-N1)-methyltransferase [Thalassotalea euphylliae]